MTERVLLRIGVTWIAALLSFAMLAFGLYWSMSIDVRFNPALSILFCALPLLSFPVFLVGILIRKAAWLQPVMAVVYLVVYAALNWRTCASMGVCAGGASIVFLTLKTKSVLAFFGAAIASVAALVLRESARPAVKSTQ